MLSYIFPAAFPLESAMPIKERVTRVIDGDTFMTDKRKRAVRLANVDAPENGERGAIAATRRLTAMVAGKEVTVMPVARDRYGRTVAKVTVEGRSVERAVKAAQKARKRKPRPFRLALNRKDRNDDLIGRLPPLARQLRRTCWKRTENGRMMSSV